MNPFKTYRWLLFGMIGALYFLAHFHRMAPTVIARDLSASFAADAMVLGFIASTYFYLYSVSQPVVGYLSDTVGPRKVMAISFMMAAGGSVLFGMAPDATTAAIGRACVGFGTGGVFIPGLKIFSRWYRVDEFAVLTGLMLTIGGLGGLFSALPLTYLVMAMGWRAAFVTIGLGSFLLAIACWVIVRDKPEDKGWPAVPTLGPWPATPSEDAMGLKRRLSLVFGNFSFWMITLSSFFTGGVLITFQGLWAGPYLMDVFHLDRIATGWALMLIPLGFALGGPVFGLMIRRLRLNDRRVVVGTLVLCMSGMLALVFIRDQSHLLIVYPMLFFFGLAGGGTTPILFTITRELFPPGLMGTATGLMNTATFLGTAIYQPFTGYILKQFPVLQPGIYPFDAYQSLIVIFLISYGAAIISISLILRRKK